uniref:Uncharacterized protein n=1 Tax=Oryza sativa subsp. japonica TaxID=39947 RepID=Q6Z078_ORYSJ|nr:hypothetical protein [Oryza sativa Japonica Group]BAD03678.1 hypothetical protein [Oryza sativa Japonica Group]
MLVTLLHRRFSRAVKRIFACGASARLEQYVCKNRYLCVRAAQPHAKIGFSRAGAYVVRTRKLKIKKKPKLKKQNPKPSRRHLPVVVAVAVARSTAFLSSSPSPSRRCRRAAAAVTPPDPRGGWPPPLDPRGGRLPSPTPAARHRRLRGGQPPSPSPRAAALAYIRRAREERIGGARARRG